jgi:hypothetical protein
MRTLKIIVLILLVFSFGCEDPFVLIPNTIISEDLVFEDEALANAYLAEMYEDALIIEEGGSDFYGHNVNMINSFGGESRNFAPWQGSFGQVIGPVFNENGAGPLNYWPYNYIRQLNEFIEKLPTSTTLDEDFIATRVAEARFLRAFAYFEMAKRYGGVPLLTIAQAIDTPESELFPARNSEKEIYDFIGSEMDEIANILPDMPDLYGRVDRWGALSLKSRAMLYAASVAQFGEVQLDGLLGFPSSDATGYYQQSLEASREIINQSRFTLYRKSNDPVQNFTDLFVDDMDNPEVIWAEIFDSESGKGHNWDNYAHPDGFGFGWNSNFPTYVEKFELFDFVDGTSGKLDPDEWYNGTTPVDPEWFFGQRDPRMRASISYPGMPWRGTQAFYHRSTTYTDASGQEQRSTSPGFIVPGSDGWPGAGPNRNRGAAVTSLQIRKRLDENLPQTGYRLSNTDFYEFRLAEIMLNYIEAAYYLGDPNGDMAGIMNDQIRERAGMPPVQITEESIRQERQVELAFEDHTFWDLRRWRIAVEELDQKVRHRFHFDYNYDTKTYTIVTAAGDRGRVRSHPERNYYYALGLGRLADNPNLVENPGY